VYKSTLYVISQVTPSVTPFLLLVSMHLQVAEVKDVMVENIERVLERGERIELLVDKADGLANQVGSAGCSRAVDHQG
jgi:hypothetical protein